MLKFIIVLFCVLGLSFCSFHSRYVDGPFEVTWVISGGIITFTASCSNSSGYVAYGICPPGGSGMNASDLVMGGVKHTGESYFADYHGRINEDRHLRPLEDESQDWTLLNAEEENNKTTITFSRALDTGDAKDDVIITAQPMTAIWACSINDNLSYHGRDRRGGHYVSFQSSNPPVVTSTTTTIRPTTTTTVRTSKPTRPPKKNSSTILKPFHLFASFFIISILFI